ncbi:type II secretion system F family protein [Iamia majanohamensis]|uniref:Type II secretion system F family protein n=1 Tax=Iamia majanohamensis TaxID=467976 RepID=A0AAE9YBA1_9ACTN|nr:type II secretion system F family protein [Iamia majanohamensis]WCO67948.1 type II secretion system F family protein [Iamia majanohamensis]
MTAIVMVVLGAGVGLGVLLTARALAPRPPSIDAVLAGLARPGHAIDAAAPTPHAELDRIGIAARRLVESLGYDSERHHQELELIGRTPERHAFDKLVAAVAGLLVPNLAATALVVLGISAPLGVIAMFSLATTAAGFLLPDLLLRDEAEKRRRAFRHALSSYLDLVNVLLAGGAGIETALHAAADAGDGWGYQTIRAELRRARLTGQSPWDTFAQLDSRLGINELAELAASVSLAGSHGARIRASLAAKADTLRGHQVAETEAAAEAATERMTVPVAVLLFGFLLFIAYPAVVQITSVSGPQP